MLFDFADRTRGGISNVMWQHTPESSVKHAHAHMQAHKSPALTQVTRHMPNVTRHVSEVSTHKRALDCSLQLNIAAEALVDEDFRSCN
jgi:hypothetical protein